MRYEFFDFRFETSAKSCIRTIPHMIQNLGILKIFKNPTALSPKSDGGRNYDCHKKIRHKILIHQIQGCPMFTRIYGRLQNRASIFAFPFINEHLPGRSRDELNSQSDMYICMPTVCIDRHYYWQMSCIQICVLRAAYEHVVKHTYRSLSCAQCLSLVLSVTRNFFWPNPLLNVS